jgi:hypothetical protein
MSDPIDFTAERQKREAHIWLPVQCVYCHSKWIAVAPLPWPTVIDCKVCGRTAVHKGDEVMEPEEFVEGQEAFRAGHPREANPYAGDPTFPDGSANGALLAWNRGWDKGAREAEVCEDLRKVGEHDKSRPVTDGRHDIGVCVPRAGLYSSEGAE